MAKFSLYLNFNGNTEEAFRFYQSVFGGEFSGLQRFNQVPGVEPPSAADGEKIMHIALPVGENLELHATDALESMGQKLTVGNNFYIMLDANSKQEADGFFNALSVGGRVEMPMQEMFWGAYYGSFADQFGVQWMVNYQHSPMP